MHRPAILLLAMAVTGCGRGTPEQVTSELPPMPPPLPPAPAAAKPDVKPLDPEPKPEAAKPVPKKDLTPFQRDAKLFCGECRAMLNLIDTRPAPIDVTAQFRNVRAVYIRMTFDDDKLKRAFQAIFKAVERESVDYAVNHRADLMLRKLGEKDKAALKAEIEKHQASAVAAAEGREQFRSMIAQLEKSVLRK